MNSLVFKSTAYVGGLLVICFLALLAYTATSTRSQNNTAFATTASTITDYLTGQINTGTRLKRGAMIMPQIEAALSNTSMDVVALRVVHTDGTEVIAEQHADITGDLFASLPPADFNSPMTTTIQGSYLIVRTPVTLGTGADQTTVGELVAIWDMQPSLEASTRQVIWTGAAFGLALLIALSGLTILLRMTVRKPLAQTIRAMSQISQEKTNVDYPDTTSSEMAAVASSLEQFQAAAIAKKQAEEAAEKAQADRLEAEAEKARQEELARAAEEATKTKELEDQHQRVAIAQKFQKQLQDVLGKASRGNFNARMADEQADEQLQTLASLINTLLQSIDANIDDVGDKLKALATGNLTVQIDGLREGSYATMQADFNQAVQELASTLQQIRVGSSSVASTASELENGSVMMSKRGEQNAATLKETSAAIEEIAASIKQVVDSTKAANEATKSVQRKATESREVADETENSIKALTTASEKINSVVKVIEDIAFQINLLALNAGVEAARAGEAGRGFSVVASEVRALAQRSQEAVQEIGSVIDENNRTVQEGVRQVARSRETLEIIAQEVDVASSQISNIALAVEEQSSGIEEIRTTIVAIDNSAQENAANLEELTASNVLLSQEANSLNTAVSKFNIEGLDPLENRTSLGSARRRTYG